jgi:hypothetical protein
MSMQASGLNTNNQGLIFFLQLGTGGITPPLYEPRLLKDNNGKFLTDNDANILTDNG